MHRKEMASLCSSNNEIITDTRGYFHLLGEFSTFVKVTYIYYKEFASKLFTKRKLLFSSKC